MQKPHADSGQNCPFWKKDMSKVCHECPLWVLVRGNNPNTGADIDQWACSISWLSILLIESTQQTRQAGAAIESFRNEMVRGNEQIQRLLLTAAKTKLIGGNGEDY